MPFGLFFVFASLSKAFNFLFLYAGVGVVGVGHTIRGRGGVGGWGGYHGCTYSCFCTTESAWIISTLRSKHVYFDKTL